MNKIHLPELSPKISSVFQPFANDLLVQEGPDIHSLYIVGSAMTPDYNPKYSDINSVVIFTKMNMSVLERLAPLGKIYGKKGIAAPLILTRKYIQESLDSFPIEFLDMKLIHAAVYGEDLLSGLEIHKHNLRLQCEREVKTMLIGLRQGYLHAIGRKDRLIAVLARSVTATVSLFRAMIVLLGKEPPVMKRDVIKGFEAATGIQAHIFEHLILLKTKIIRPAEAELKNLFENYYNALEETGAIIERLHV